MDRRLMPGTFIDDPFPEDYGDWTWGELEDFTRKVLADRDLLIDVLRQVRPIVSLSAAGYDSHRPPDAANAIKAIDDALAATEKV